MLNIFGKINDNGHKVRNLILLESHLIEDLMQSDLSIGNELAAFVNALDNLSVTAGPYFSCTHGFLFSFYSVLVTYIAILVQSI